MGLYSKAVVLAAAGAVADTFQAMPVVTLRSDAKRVAGILMEAGTTTTTAAEANHGQCQISSSDLGVGIQTYSCPPYIGGGIATNNQTVVSATEFIPFNYKDMDNGKSLGKAQIQIDYTTQLADPAAGSDVFAAVVYEAGLSGVSADAMSWFPNMNPLIGKGADCEALGTVTTVAETAIADLNLPAWANEIIGFKGYSVPAAVMTAAEGLTGGIRLRSTLPDFEPQEWPFTYALNASLGTPVGQPVSLGPNLAYAHSFSLAGHRNETISSYAYLVVASTSNQSVSSTVYFR